MLDVEKVRAVADDAENRTFEFVAATENFVRVFARDRGEVIRESLAMDGVDLSRFPQGERGPAAFDNHRTAGSEFVVGKVVRTRVEASHLVVTITFTEATEAGRRNLALVRDNTLRTLSIGYRVNDSQTTGDVTRGEAHVLVTQWALREVSTAALPADPDAQLRSHQEHH